MQIIKEYSKYAKKCVIRTNSYSSSLSYFNELIEIAKNDFPELIDDNIEIVQYGGERIKRIFGIEFYPTNYVPSSYNEIQNLEYKL